MGYGSVVDKAQMNINVSKRLLNITKHLPMLAFTEEKVNSKEVKEQLKSLGIATFRKCLGKNKYLATCRTFEQYDHFCAQSPFVINGKNIVFRPLHTKRPSRKGKPKQNKTVEADDDDENYIDNENDVDNGEESDDDDFKFNADVEEIGEVIMDDDDKKKIQVKTDDINADECKADESTSDLVKESIVEDVGSVKGTESKISTKAEEITVKLETAYKNKIDDAKETVETEVKTKQVVNELDNAETAKLYHDIKALSDSINKKVVDNKDIVAIENVNDNILSIDQDDLEDF